LFGNGNGKAISRRRVDSGKFYRHTAERREEWVGFETSSFTTIVKEDGIRGRGMCSVCLEAKDTIKPENSATVHNSRFKSTCGAPQ